MIELSQMRELFAYDINRDSTIIRHDIKCGDDQWNCRYYIKSRDRRKLLNPLTIWRYRARSQRLLFDKIVNEGKSVADITSLPAPIGYTIPNRYAKLLTHEITGAEQRPLNKTTAA